MNPYEKSLRLLFGLIPASRKRRHAAALVLQELLENPGGTGIVIVRATGIEAGNLYPMLDNWNSKGLVERKRVANPGKPPSFHYTLTQPEAASTFVHVELLL